MCGIAGMWRPGGLDQSAEPALARMSDALAHRGPDGSGAWLDLDSGIGLGHRRLAILDPSPCGAQPMLSPSGRFVLSFNGEFYNWRELRAEEERHGARWRGHADTEVFLALCERVGIAEAVTRASGMFAFAIWDRAERALTLVRDRMGEKPLYYGWAGSTLLFGSELKAFADHPDWNPEIDRNAIALYLRHNYVPAPHTIHTAARKLLPGHLITFSANSARWPASNAYWSLREVAERGSQEPFTESADEVSQQLEQLLLRVVGEEMVADVPLGAFLSGGIDSSLIVALMQQQSTRPVRTYTIGFRERDYNEADAARAVAAHLGTNHTELYISPGDALAVVPRLPAMYDEPFADVSQIPTHLVAALARQTVTVALSGDGGDESFGGYQRYLLTPRIWSRLSRMPLPMRRTAAGALRSVSPARWDRVIGLLPAQRRYRVTGDRVHKLAGLFAARSSGEVYRHLHSHWQHPDQLVIGGTEAPTALTDPAQQPQLADQVSAMMAADSLSYLPDDIMVKVDRAAMAVGLESRAPLLHHQVVEFAWRIPAAQRIENGRGKMPLRRILDRYVPAALVDRPKTGFGVPIEHWLRGDLREWAESLLDPERLRREGFLRPELITRAWLEHQSGVRNWQYHLWDILMFQAWLEAQPAKLH